MNVGAKFICLFINNTKVFFKDNINIMAKDLP